MGIASTAMFYIPKIVQVGHFKDDACHSGAPTRENCKRVTLSEGAESSPWGSLFLGALLATLDIFIKLVTL